MLRIGRKIKKRFFRPSSSAGFTPFETTSILLSNKNVALSKRVVNKATARYRRSPQGDLSQTGFTPFETTQSSLIDKNKTILNQGIGNTSRRHRRLPQGNLSQTGFTLTEVVLAVALLATGLVYILGALNQCLKVHANAQREIEANYVLDNLIKDYDICRSRSRFAEDACLNILDFPPKGFNLTRIVSPVMADFSDENSLIQDNFYQEEFHLSWKSGKAVKDISYVRYVKKKKK